MTCPNAGSNTVAGKVHLPRRFDSAVPLSVGRLFGGGLAEYCGGASVANRRPCQPRNPCPASIAEERHASAWG